MAKRPAKPRRAEHDRPEFSRVSSQNLADEPTGGEADDELELLDDIDPRGDVSCWDLEDLELEEPDWDERDFYLEDERDDEV